MNPDTGMLSLGHAAQVEGKALQILSSNCEPSTDICNSRFLTASELRAMKEGGSPGDSPESS